MIGPAPCSDCHVPLFLAASGRWMERHWERDAKDALVAVYKIHSCTALAPAAVRPLLPSDYRDRSRGA